MFFDLNTVMNQLDPNSLSTDGKNPAANSLGASTGYVNWYDIAFDPEGYINGSPMMLVSSVDRSDPAKNAIYMISPSGQFLGAFVMMNNYTVATKFNMNPTGMVIPGPQFQATPSRPARGQRDHHDRRHLRRTLLQLERLLPRPGHQQWHPAQGGLANRHDPGNDRRE